MCLAYNLNVIPKMTSSRVKLHVKQYVNFCQSRFTYKHLLSRSNLLKCNTLHLWIFLTTETNNIQIRNQLNKPKVITSSTHFYTPYIRKDPSTSIVTSPSLSTLRRHPAVVLTTTAATRTMASEGGAKPDDHQPPMTRSKVDLIIVTLRLLAFLATLSATLVMALNKQTRTVVVATIGTVPIQATVHAKFQHTPAFVFFVIANGNASLHNLLMLVVSFMGSKCNFKGLAPLAIPVLDVLNVAIVSGGASAAAFMGQLGRDGNSHARWNKICDKINRFCDRSGGAMVASFAGLMLMTILCSISIIRLRNYYTKIALNSSVVP